MLYKTQIIKKMQDYFGDDQKRINHTLEVTGYAEELIEKSLKENENLDIKPEVIIYSSILHDIGIKNSEIKYNNSEPKYQEIEGPPVARNILNHFPLDKKIINEICEIIGNHHSPGKINTYNFKLVYDADWLVNLPETVDLSEKNNEEITQIINKLYLSNAGQKRAIKLFTN